MVVADRAGDRPTSSPWSTAAGDHDVVVVGTIAADAHPTQAAMVRRFVERGSRLVTVALRTPYDLATYPEAGTARVHVFPARAVDVGPGRCPVRGGTLPGTLPVSIPGLHPAGHGLTTRETS